MFLRFFTAALFVFSALIPLAGQPAPAPPVEVYSQPPAGSSALLLSSRWDPDGSDYDRYAWDNFTLPTSQAITEIRWRGGHDPSGSVEPVIDFLVAIYPSIPAGIQPDVVHPPLVSYHTGGNAGETPAGVFGSATLFDYAFILPVPFQAAGGTKYWVQIEAAQAGRPDWGLAAGSGGDGSYFRRLSQAADTVFQTVTGDGAFSLWGPAAAIAGLSAANDGPTVLGQVTTFTASASAGNGIAYTWDFGDGTGASGQVVAHTYAAPGSYQVVVTAGNPLGSLTASTSATVTTHRLIFIPAALMKFRSP